MKAKLPIDYSTAIYPNATPASNARRMAALMNATFKQFERSLGSNTSPTEQTPSPLDAPQLPGGHNVAGEDADAPNAPPV